MKMAAETAKRVETQEEERFYATSKVGHDWKGGIRGADRAEETRQIPASKTAKVHYYYITF
jgi:hypothetical protein